MQRDAFIPWVGSKRTLIHALSVKLPRTIREYREPFIGSGALLFHLLRNRSFYGLERARISDLNESLITLYKVVRGQLDALLAQLEGVYTDVKQVDGDLQALSDYYYARREEYNALKESGGKGVRLSALFLYLTANSYRSQYRENARGKFNASFRKNANYGFYEPLSLRAYSELLNGAAMEIKACDYRENEPTSIDELVYLDPPYEGNVVKYVSSGSGVTFNREAFLGYAEAVRSRSRVLISYSSPIINYASEELEMRYKLSRKGSNCRYGKEYINWNY